MYSSLASPMIWDEDGPPDIIWCLAASTPPFDGSPEEPFDVISDVPTKDRAKNKLPISVAGTLRVPSGGYGTRSVPTTPKNRHCQHAPIVIQCLLASAEDRAAVGSDPTAEHR